MNLDLARNIQPCVVGDYLHWYNYDARHWLCIAYDSLHSVLHRWSQETGCWLGGRILQWSTWRTIGIGPFQVSILASNYFCPSITHWIYGSGHVFFFLSFALFQTDLACWSDQSDGDPRWRSDLRPHSWLSALLWCHTSCRLLLVSYSTAWIPSSLALVKMPLKTSSPKDLRLWGLHYLYFYPQDCLRTLCGTSPLSATLTGPDIFSAVLPRVPPAHTAFVSPAPIPSSPASTQNHPVGLENSKKRLTLLPNPPHPASSTSLEPSSPSFTSWSSSSYHTPLHHAGWFTWFQCSLI